MADASLLAEILTAGLTFDAPEWSRLLKEMARPLIARMVLLGALDEIAAHNLALSDPLLAKAPRTLGRGPCAPAWLKASSASRWLEDHGIEAPDGIATELPENLRVRIESAVDTFMNQPWWDDTGQSIRTEIRDIIQKGIADGKTIRQIRIELEKSSAVLSKQRALRIARTEVNGAIQAGRFEVMEEVSEESGGLLGGKEWMTNLDGKERQTHHAADGQIVPIAEPFNIGGSPGMYPGDTSLPAGERVNCRCQIMSATLAEALGQPLTSGDVPPVQDTRIEDVADDMADVGAVSGNATSAKFEPTTAWDFQEDLNRLQSAAAEWNVRKVRPTGFAVGAGIEAANQAMNVVAYAVESAPAIGKTLAKRPIESIQIVNADYFRAGGERQAGTYDPTKKKIKIAYLQPHAMTRGARPVPLNTEADVTLGADRAAPGAAHVLRNELGHHIDAILGVTLTRRGTRPKNLAAFLGSNKRFRSFVKALRDAGGPLAISVEAARGASEAFAEAFAIMLHPRYKEGARLPTPLEVWFAHEVFGDVEPWRVR